MKRCNSCNGTKEKSQFGKRAASIDGLAAKCKDCQSEYDKARLRDPKRMKARRDYQKTDKGRAAHSMACKSWLDKNQVKRSAHIMVGNAIKSGKIIKCTCEACGELAEAHHDDYSLPLVVRWLCVTHHNEWHRENGEGINAS